MLNVTTIRKRCAIYTRKSVDDGTLETQDFSSLDAQREAGEAYIASQKANGWVCLPERYDDGGFSGGNMERPALKKLLSDCQAGLIDIIVVYKIDRLSRSICDFADLSKKFDAWGIQFVSVTQEINTATSAGRMMLNILITFAQYEREQIAERIRDKMSASRKKGKWVGGSVPLGYKVIEKRLVVDPETASIVQRVFQRFIEIQSPMTIAAEMNHEGLRTRQGKLWSASHIYRMLNNYTYIGEVNYKNNICKGEQDAIIELPVWNRVHTILRENAPIKHRGVRLDTLAPLRGILRCGHCDGAMKPTYVNKNGRKYYYYLCSKDIKRAEHSCPLRKVPAGEVESVVREELKHLFLTDAFVAGIAEKTGIRQHVVMDLLNQEFWEQLQMAEFQRLATLLIEKAILRTDSLELTIRTEGVKSIIEEFNHEED